MIRCMDGVVINGIQEPVPGSRVTSWHTDPGLRLGGEDRRLRRTRWIRGIVLHTTKGIPGGTDHRQQIILPGYGPDTNADNRSARLWSTDGRGAGAHLVVDHDGQVSCLADLLLEAAYHAGPVNEVTIGIELYQGNAAELYEGQLEAVVHLCNWLTARFGIQRQIPVLNHKSVISRCSLGAEDVVGVYGHRHVTTNRGPGDPGDAVFERLAAAGYETFDFAAGADLDLWTIRQKSMGVTPADGIPGPATLEALRAAGYPDGLFTAARG
jgi:hypothetical protein